MRPIFRNRSKEVPLTKINFMKRHAFLFFSVVMIFWSCEDKMKRTIELGEKVESEERPSIEEPPKEEILTIEKIAELANQGNLESIIPKTSIERETLWINEGTDQVKAIWLNKGDKDEVRIDFRPKDSTKVFRVTVNGRENKFASKTGVKTGMSIDQINSLNRKSVDFFGFNWDFGGVAKFNEGALEDKNLFVYFKTDKKVGKRFIGDTTHGFEEAKEAKLDLYVNKIIYAPAKNNQL